MASAEPKGQLPSVMNQSAGHVDEPVADGLHGICSTTLEDLPGGASEMLVLAVVITDPLPPGTSKLINIASVSTATPCDGDLCLEFAEVPAGFVLDDLFLEGFPQGQVIVTALVTVSSPDPDLENNEDRLILPLLKTVAVPVLGPFGFLVTFVSLVVCGWWRMRRRG